MSTMYDAAARLYAAHISVVPCWTDSKQPALREWSSWQQERPAAEQIHRWFKHNDRALAVVCGAVSGNLEGIDVDNKPQRGYPDATTLLARLQAHVEADAPGLWSRLVVDHSPNGGYHLAYRCATIARNQKLAQRPATDAERTEANNGKLDRVTLIETRGEGGYLISAPSPGYERIQGDLADPPLLTTDERTILFTAARSLNLFVPSSRIVGNVASANGTKPGADYNARTTVDDVQGVLEAANWTVVRSSGDGCRYLRRPGKDEGWSATLGHAGTNLLYVFSSNATPFEPDTAYTPFAVYTLLEHDGDFKAAARALGKGGYGDQRTREALPHVYTVRATSGSSDAGEDVLGHLVDANQTDAGNAECLALVYGNELRYCHTRNKWLHWDRTRWMIDTDGKAQRAALDVARIRQAAALRIDDMERKRKAMSWGFTSESNAKRLAMLQTAAILEQFATTVDQYDRDPLLATVMNGTLDLHNGTSRPSHRDDYLTMQLGTIHTPDACCPRWLQFLDEVFGGDKELIAYIQRAVGYSLTGATSEQKLFLLHGAGANGKSVFLEVLSLLLADYAANTSFDTFDAGRRNEATNDLAALKGKRLVTVIETDEDRRLAEARVKAVTGQDTITCRFLYGEFFSYRPQFKIWLAMNHKPIIRGTDRGIWRRIQLVPFTQNFEGRADTHLRDKLQAELPGILNWALTGLQVWLAHGVGTAAAVARATDEY